MNHSVWAAELVLNCLANTVGEIECCINGTSV